jgi:16S rRNA (cytosine1402-N4)-methyltransferase
MKTEEGQYHEAVLLHTSLSWMNIRPDGVIVDLTFGGGGHSREILNRLGEKGRLISFDQDPDAVRNVREDNRFTLVPFRFDQLDLQLSRLGITAVDAILGDLGISSHQIDTPDRGFSYRFDAPLDMRMNPEEGETAAEVLNSRSHGELAKIFRVYGDLDSAGKMASRILEFRRSRPVLTTMDLKEALGNLIPKDKPAAFLSRVYQALRIEVNEEMTVLESMLSQTLKCLRPGGRLVIISYHSLEDRMVKRFMRSGNFEGEPMKDAFGNSLTPWKVLTRQAIQPDAEEMERNPRARSARLRVAEKLS